jgi:hypothetical protein
LTILKRVLRNSDRENATVPYLFIRGEENVNVLRNNGMHWLEDAKFVLTASMKDQLLQLQDREDLLLLK